jgi:hypothetical protein
VKKGFEWPESRGFCGIRLVVREHDIPNLRWFNLLTVVQQNPIDLAPMPCSESKQTKSTDREGDLEERALYLQFRETLRSLEGLIDHFEKMTPEIQRDLQEQYEILLSWDEAGMQDLRTRLQAMIQGMEWLADALDPDEPSDSEFQ